jgi:DNA-binding response OmpR family regulator
MAREVSQMVKILVIEDDASLREALVYNLRRDDYTPLVATDAPSGLATARREKPDLVVLDLMLPGGSGFDVCRSIRAFSTVPIIILTARDEDIDRVLGLELGADDYVTKPFSLRELLARIKANLRRLDYDRAEESSDYLTHGRLVVDVRARSVVAEDESITLQPKEFDLLVYFMRNPGVVLTRDRLLRAVWGHEYVGERTVDVHVRRVRAKLELAHAPDPIRTVHGVGYAFEAQSSSEPASFGSEPS